MQAAYDPLARWCRSIERVTLCSMIRKIKYGSQQVVTKDLPPQRARRILRPSSGKRVNPGYGLTQHE